MFKGYHNSREGRKIEILAIIPSVQNKYQLYVFASCLFPLGSDNCMKDILFNEKTSHI